MIKLKMALFTHFALALISIIFGFIYLFSNEFMSYHSDAIGKSWSELDTNIQIVLTGFMRVTAGGFLCSGILEYV